MVTLSKKIIEHADNTRILLFNIKTIDSSILCQ